MRRFSDRWVYGLVGVCTFLNAVMFIFSLAAMSYTVWEVSKINASVGAAVWTHLRMGVDLER